MELRVHCNNKGRGCEWTGMASTLDGHIASCQYTLVSCPKCWEGSLLRKHINDHLKACPLRACECQECGMKGTYVSMRNHGSICEEAIVACPNQGKGCPVSVKRGKMDRHLKDECEFTEVSCAYESLGCPVRMMRRDIVKHQENDDKHHLHLALGCIRSDKEKVKTLQEEQFFMFKLTEYITKKRGNTICYSEPFYSHPGGYKMCVVIYPNGVLEGESTHLSVCIKILHGEYDKSLVWPFRGFVNFELLNQLSNDNHHFATSLYFESDEMHVGHCKGNARFLSLSVLSNSPSEHVQYLLADCLHFRVSVKAVCQRLWLENEQLSTIGRSISISENKPIIFKVSGYSVKKAADSCYCSEVFGIYPGHSVQLWFYANGCDAYRNQKLSLFLYFYGFHDIRLPRPSVKSVNFTLLNQWEDKRHAIRNVNCQNVQHIAEKGFNVCVKGFIAHSELPFKKARRTQYLKDDTLYFKVSVVMDKHKPWLVGGHSV